MVVEGDKIKELIADYSKGKGYPEKSYVTQFCEDFSLNYKQWNAYCNGSQDLGIKIIQILMDIFPNLNLNWLLKDDSSKYLDSNYVLEPKNIYQKEVSNEMLMNKLENIEILLKSKLK